MRKLKMFMVACIALVVGGVSVNALSFGFFVGTDGTLSYYKGADDTFSYQVVKVTQEDWSSIDSEATAKISELDTANDEIETAYDNYSASVDAYNDAVEEQQKDDNTETQEKVAAAKAKMESDKSIYENAVAAYNTKLNELMDIVKKVAPYSIDNMTNVTDDSTSGKITIRSEGDTDVHTYVLWTKSDDYADLNGDSVSIQLFSNNINTPENPSDVETVTNPTTTKDEVENPKTGVNMPIVLGMGVVVFAVAGIVICKKLSTKQL